jgi:hypothetical protein
VEAAALAAAGAGPEEAAVGGPAAAAAAAALAASFANFSAARFAAHVPLPPLAPGGTSGEDAFWGKTPLFILEMSSAAYCYSIRFPPVSREATQFHLSISFLVCGEAKLSTLINGH